VSVRRNAVNVLLICRGNLCRSPMAMALLQSRLESEGLAGRVVVDSAGYYDWGPFPREAHPFARRVVQELCGSDMLAAHSARRWSAGQVCRATHILVAEAWMRTDFPAGKVMTLKEFGRENGDVEDPYGGDYMEFLACAKEIQRLLEAGMPRFYVLLGLPSRP
jgi:protein-tyrosine-phosphatase